MKRKPVLHIVPALLMLTAAILLTLHFLPRGSGEWLYFRLGQPGGWLYMDMDFCDSLYRINSDIPGSCEEVYNSDSVWLHTVYGDTVHIVDYTQGKLLTLKYGKVSEERNIDLSPWGTARQYPNILGCDGASLWLNHSGETGESAFVYAYMQGGELTALTGDRRGGEHREERLSLPCE